MEASETIKLLEERLARAEARLAEKAGLGAVVRESDTRHRLVVGTWAQAVWETDAAGVVTADSPSWRAYTGQTVDEWLGYGWLDAIHPDDRAYAERQWREAIAARSLVDAEFRLRASDGGWRWTNVRAAPVLDAEGRIEKWAGINIDINDRKSTEAELRQSEERHAYFLTLSDTLRPLADKEEIQAKAMQLLGEKLGLNRAQYYIADETGEYLSSTGGYSNGIPAAIGNFHLIEFGQYAYDGFHAGETQVLCDARIDPRISEAVLRSYETVGFMAYIGVPFVQRGRLVGTLAVHQSEPRQWTVSERMMVEETAERTGIAVEQARAEARLREIQERQAFLLELSDKLRPLDDPAIIQATATRAVGEHLSVDRTQYHEIEPNDEWLTAGGGYARTGQLHDGRVHMDDFGGFVKEAYRSGRTLVVGDTQTDPRVTAAERKAFVAIGVGAFLAVPIVKQGRFVGTLGLDAAAPRDWSNADIAVAQDVAERTWAAVERARAETELRQSEARFKQFANASASGLWIRDAETLRMEFVSAAIPAIYDTAPAEFIGDIERWAARIVPEDRDIALDCIKEARDGKPTVHEFRIRRDDGSFRWIRNTAFPLSDEKGNVERIGGIAEDVTDVKVAVEHQRVLLHELQHRVRNIMAMIRATAITSAANAADVEDYKTSFAKRLMALARVQTLLTRQANAGGSLRSILESEIGAQAHSDN